MEIRSGRSALVEQTEPKVDRVVDPRAVVRRAEIQQEAAETRDHHRRVRSRIVARTARSRRTSFERMQPFLDGVSRESRKSRTILQRERIDLEEQPHERLPLRSAVVAPQDARDLAR